ncbi:hypothetical protein SB748_26825 [Rhizobium sp. SIMBA_035]
MSNEEDNEGRPLAAPMVAKREPKEQSLDLENVDMSKDGIQGDVLVSKGRSHLRHQGQKAEGWLTQVNSSNRLLTTVAGSRSLNGTMNTDRPSERRLLSGARL